MTVQSGSRVEGRPHLRAVSGHDDVPFMGVPFMPPRFPPDLVARDTAVWLDRLLSHELMLVRVPAGYGKTAWCAALWDEAIAAGWRGAWVAGDTRGDDGASTLAADLSALAAQIEAAGTPFLLIVDDADELSDAPAIAVLDRLLRRPPASLRLILAGRGVFPVDIGSADRRGMALAVTADDLRLTDGEVLRFLGAEDDGIAGMIEGWPAGARLAAKGGGIDAVIARAEAYFRPIFDALPPDRVAFLRRASTVSALNAELGALLGGDERAGDMLRDVTARGLLLGDVAGDGWWRLHPLLRAVLSRRLAAEEPGTASQLHRIAARYLASQGKPGEAVEQFLAAGDPDQAAPLVGRLAMPLIEQGECETPARWIDALPAAIVDDDLPLAAARAWLSILRADASEAHAFTTLARSAAAEAAAIDLVRRAHLGDEFADVVERCDQFLGAPGAASDFAVAMVRAMLAHGALRRGLFGLVHEAVRPLLLRGTGRPLDLPLALATATRASLARAQGQLGEAERILRDAPPGSHLAGAIVAASLARCCYERDDFANAEALAAGALPHLEASPFQDALIQASLVAIRVAAGTAQPGRAASLIDRAELIAFARGWAPLKAMCVVERARLHLPPTIDPEAVLAIGDEEAAVRDPLASQGRTFALLAEMRAYEAIANGDRPRLTAVADRLLQLASNADDAELRASATLFNILPQLSGRCDKMVDLETVRFLNHAAGSGFRRTIVDVLDVTGVRAVQNFCSEAYSSGSFLALLKLAEPSRRNPALEGGHGSAPGEAFSFLTEREIEILSALNAGESNKEIARTLQLAPETVKWHLKNVMRKLRAGSREEAVANAATLGLKLIEAH